MKTGLINADQDSSPWVPFEGWGDTVSYDPAGCTIEDEDDFRIITSIVSSSDGTALIFGWDGNIGPVPEIFITGLLETFRRPGNMIGSGATIKLV